MVPFVDVVLRWFCNAWAVISAAAAVFFTSSNDVDVELMTSDDDNIVLNALSIDCSTRI
jgi:hypothetical protein